MSANVILKHGSKILYDSSGGAGGGGVIKNLAFYGSIPHVHCHDSSILNFINIIVFSMSPFIYAVR